LSYLASWTIDAGDGIDDFLVAVGSNGDVMVYKGTDPSAAATFSLVGVWFIGQIPVGRRAYCQFGGDLVLISAEGVYPISYVTRGGAEMLQASSKEYSSKIRAAIGPDLRASFTQRGWEALVHPSERVIMVGVPDYGPRKSFQYALSTTTNQWTTFQDIPAYSYGIIGGYSFVGTRDGRVLITLNGFFDAVAYGASVGDGIYGTIQQAYSGFNAPALSKHFMMIRPAFLSEGEPGISAEVTVNYKMSELASFPTYTIGSLAVWDVSLWDVAKWSGGPRSFADWRSVGSIGFAGSATLRTACVGDTILAGIDYMYSIGGPL
jgi:hypothetical protein